MRRVGDVQILMAGYHVAGRRAHGFRAAADRRRACSRDAPSGRLYKALVETGLASQVGVQTLQLRDPGMLIFFALVRRRRIARRKRATR